MMIYGMDAGWSFALLLGLFRVITREANSEWNPQSSLRLLRLQYIYEILWVCEQFQQITFRNIVNARNATVEWTDLHNGLSQEDQHFVDAYGLATWACALHVQPMHIYDLWFIYALWSNNVAVAMSLATLDPCFTSISIRFVWSAVNQNWLGLNMQIHIFSSIWSANVGLQTSIYTWFIVGTRWNSSFFSVTLNSWKWPSFHTAFLSARSRLCRGETLFSGKWPRSKEHLFTSLYTTFIGCLVGKKFQCSSSSFFQFQDQVYFSSAMILPLSLGLPLWSLT